MPSGSDEETDVLGFVFPIMLRCMELSKHTVLKVLFIGNLAIWMVFISVQLIYCLRASTVEYWAQYGPMLLALLILNGECLTQMSSLKNFLILRRKLMSEFCWDLDLVTPSTKQYILKLCKRIDRRFVLLLLIVILGTALVEKDLEPNLFDVIVACHYIKTYAPSFITPVIWYIRCDAIISAFILTCVPLHSFYCFFLFKIKAIILISKIEDFSEELQIFGTDNDLIKQRLKEIIEKHQEIIRLHVMVIKETYIINALLVLGLIPLMIFTVETIFIPQFSQLTSIWAVSTLLLYMAVLSHEGQLAEDLIGQLSTLLYDLEWYNWHISNMKTLLMFLINTSIPLQWNLVILTDDINHTYFKKVTKTLYTVFNLLRSFSS